MPSAKVTPRSTRLGSVVQAASAAASSAAKGAQELATGTGQGLNQSLAFPAYMMIIAYIVMAVVMLLPFDMPVYDEQTGEYTVVPYSFGHRLLMLLFLAIPVIASVYSVHCMVVGECSIWSYVVAIVHIFWVAVFVLVALLYVFRGKSATPSTAEKTQ